MKKALEYLKEKRPYFTPNGGIGEITSLMDAFAEQCLTALTKEHEAEMIAFAEFALDFDRNGLLTTPELLAQFREETKGKEVSK